MAKVALVVGTTSYIARVFIQDSSSSTGAGLTGLTSATSNLVCYAARDDDGNANAVQISLSGGTRGTYSSGGFIQKDATNMPGIYELGIPTATLATGSKTATVMLKGATNMAPCVLEFELTAINNQSTGFGLVNASANAAQINGVSTSPVTTIKAVQGLAVDGVITTATNLTNAPTAGDFTATMKTSLSAATPALSAAGNNAVADALLDRADAIEVGLTPRQAMRLDSAALGGVLSGAATTTVVVKNAVANSKTRITATVDANGNRSAVSTDVT